VEGPINSRFKVGFLYLPISYHKFTMIKAKQLILLSPFGRQNILLQKKEEKKKKNKICMCNRNAKLPKKMLVLHN